MIRWIVLVVWATLFIAAWLTGFAHATWKPEYADSDPAVRSWYEQAQLTDSAQKRFGFVNCCAHSDVVQTQFRVSHNDSSDQWWWLDKGAWARIPDDIIHWNESAPDGQPTLFALSDGRPTCFYPGRSGD